MTRKTVLLIIAVAFLGICASTTVVAFAVPWSWNPDQALFAWLVLCTAVILGIWGTVWLRGGNAAVKVRWKKTLEGAADALTGKRIWRSMVFWIVIAIVLVFIFNMTQR